MMTSLEIVITGANLVVSACALALVARIERRHRSPATDPSQLAVALGTAAAADAAELEAMAGALDNPDPRPWNALRAELAKRVHYVIQRVEGLTTIVEYDGWDSDLAVAAWVRIERDPASYPGTHEFLENGRRRGHRVEGSPS